MNTPVYLDHNASSPVGETVAAAMAEALRLTGNASSIHGFGRLHRQRVEEAREEVAALAGVKPNRVVFTSGGTEANNLALKAGGHRRIIVSGIEHDSVLQAVQNSETLRTGTNGIVDWSRLADSTVSEPTLVSVMLANNETGVIQPISDIVESASRVGAVVHTDAVQAAGRIPLDISSLGVAMASLSAHKIGGPQGVGALVLGTEFPFSAQIRGGGQERGRRAGTENTAGIVGFGVAARLARARINDMPAIGRLRDEMEARLRREINDLAVFGDSAPRLANTSCFAVPGLRAETQVMALDLAGLAVSAGSACSSGKVTPSHVLRAMSVPEALAGCAIRVSLGPENSGADVDRLVTTLVGLRRRAGTHPANAA